MSRRFSSDIIEQVVTSSDIVDTISQYVTLNKVGTSYKCCCPFHDEKTPSFVISPDKQLYHCFGCDAGGNVINFIMDMENMDFIEAVKHLAEKARIDLPYDEHYSEELAKGRQRLEEIHRDAAVFYHKSLVENISAQQYLFKRGIEQKTIKKFGIGYAPSNGNSLFNYLLKQHYSTNEMMMSGLILKGKHNNNYYDRFRDRIIFPILSVTNKVVAFGGRVLNSEKFPKYLNSPETKIFTKGKQLYGLNNAKKNIIKDQIVLVEGYMDVISLYQKGVYNVVATLGTALTRDQGMLLKRYVKEVIIAYDGDNAGQNAATKAVGILQQCDLSVKVILFPQGIDPDEYISEHGLNEFNDKKTSALSAMEYKIVKLKEKYNTNSLEGRISFLDEISQYLASIENNIQRESYIDLIIKEMGISKQAINSEISKYRSDMNKKNHDGNYRKEKKHKKFTANEIAQIRILQIIINNKRVYNSFKSQIVIDNFTGGIYKILAEYIIKKMENNENIEPSTFITNFSKEDDIKIATLIFTTNEESSEEQDISSYLNTINRFKIQKDIKILQEEMLKINNNEEKNRIFYEIIDKKKQLEAMK